MLGDNIKRLRKSKNISINSLSKNTKISLGYLSDLENNKAKNPTIDKLEIIAAALGTTTKELLSTEDKLDIAVDSINEIAEMAKKALQYDSNESTQDCRSNMCLVFEKFKNIDFTKTECEDITNYISYVLSKRK